jgi:hypothetical protein
MIPNSGSPHEHRLYTILNRPGRERSFAEPMHDSGTHDGHSITTMPRIHVGWAEGAMLSRIRAASPAKGVRRYPARERQYDARAYPTRGMGLYCWPASNAAWCCLS